jgi:chemotaxis signal transduction protein
VSTAADDVTRAPVDGIQGTGAITEVLTFRVGVERFAIDVTAAEEVIELPVISPLPAMSPSMLGVCELRGALLPVYSAARALKVPLVKPAAAIVMRVAGRRLGVAVCAAEGVTLWESAAAGFAGGDGMLLGITMHSGALLALIDARKLAAACVGGLA